MAGFAAAHPERVDRLVPIDAASSKFTLSGPQPANFAPDTVEDQHTLLATALEARFAPPPAFAVWAPKEFRTSGEAATPGNCSRPLDRRTTGSSTLVAWVANDRLFAAALADVVLAGIPGSRKVLIPYASHFPQLDNPDALISALLAFPR